MFAKIHHKLKMAVRINHMVWGGISSFFWHVWSAVHFLRHLHGSKMILMTSSTCCSLPCLFQREKHVGFQNGNETWWGEVSILMID